MPLSDLQTETLRLLATHRNPESYVAGATALNQYGPRFSSDIDIFHDHEDAVACASEADAALLAANYWPSSPEIGGAMVRQEDQTPPSRDPPNTDSPTSN